MKLFAHQQKIVDKAPDKILLAHACGTGKTLTLAKLAEKKGGKWVIVCPKSIVDQWREKLAEYGITLDCIILSKENFKKRWNELPESNLIIDESHMFSGMHSIKKKSGMLKSALSYVKKHNPRCVYLATGTPYLSSPWNIYAQAEILGTVWPYSAFKAKFFQEVNMGMRWPVPVVRKNVEWKGKVIPTSKAVELLVKSIGDVVTMDDCFDVPEQTFKTEYFELTKEQIKAISKIEETTPIVRWTQTHQICGGTLKGDGYREDQTFKCEKMDRLLELCQENKKLIVVCRYNNEIEVIAKILEKEKFINVYKITGATKDKNELLKSAESDDKAILLVNAFCSEGWQAPSFPIMVFYSYDFSLKNFIQMIGRVLRADHLKKNTYISLIIKDTIDHDVKKSMDRKEDFKIENYS